MFKSKEVFSGILSSTCASNWSLFTSEITSNIPFKIPCITELVQFEVLKKIMFKNTLWKPTDTWFYSGNFSIYIRIEAFVFCKRKFVCLFMPSGVHELSLNNTDWILKYFLFIKSPRGNIVTSIGQKWEDMAVVVLDQNHHWTDTERKITENGKLLKVHPLFIQTKKDLNKQINYLKIKVL